MLLQTVHYMCIEIEVIFMYWLLYPKILLNLFVNSNSFLMETRIFLHRKGNSFYLDSSPLGVEQCWPRRWDDASKIKLFFVPILHGYFQKFGSTVLLKFLKVDSWALLELCLFVNSCLTVDLCGKVESLLLPHLGDITPFILFKIYRSFI